MSGRGRSSLTDSWEKRGKLWLQTSGLLSYKAWTFHIRLYRQICRNEWRTGKWEESRDNLCLFAAVFRAECLTYFAWLLRSVTFTLPRTKFRYSLKRQAQKHIKKKWEQNLPCNDGWMVRIRHQVLTHFSLANMPPYQRTHFPFLWFVFWCLLLVLVLSRHMFVCTCGQKTKHFHICMPQKIKN